MYCGKDKKISIQYEEGSLSNSEFLALLSDLLDHLKDTFGVEAQIKGLHEDDPQQRMMKDLT
ncbi:hypothetical protein MLD52_17785 [Puniceicoccaceae bacterium K14]|nr:hypothetical protein [Puniceicoccaceae bacterium K14]